MSNKRYVGIDMSSLTGFVILNHLGEVIVEEELWFPYKKDPERMMYIVGEILGRINKETDVIGIENFSYGSKGRGIDFQFGLGWVMREKLTSLGYKYYDVAPGGVKKYATGNGSVKKEVMVLPLYRRWGYFNASDNVTDAFVLAKIAEGLDKGCEGLKEHEKQVVRTVKNSVLNKEEWEEQKPPPKRRKTIEDIIRKQ